VVADERLELVDDAAARGVGQLRRDRRVGARAVEDGALCWCDVVGGLRGVAARFAAAEEKALMSFI
jgi:hypothetical protein